MNIYYKMHVLCNIGFITCLICHLLIIFANSLDPDQARHFVGPDLDPNCFDSLMVYLKDFFENINFEINQQTAKKA